METTNPKPSLAQLQQSGAVFPASELKKDAMRMFSLTSPAFAGEVLFEFRNDLLVKFDMSGAELNEKQHTTLACNLPRTLDEVSAFMAKSKNAIFTEIVQDITFEMFWARYFQGRRVDNSSKKRTKTKWDRMPKAQRLKAYNYISKYFAGIMGGCVAKYAETYLNAELWNN